MLPKSTYTLQCVQNSNYIIMQVPSCHFRSIHKDGCYFILILQIYLLSEFKADITFLFYLAVLESDSCYISIINFNLNLLLDMLPSFFFVKKALTFGLPCQGYMQVNKGIIRGNCFVCFRNNCQLRCVRLTMCISIRIRKYS